MRCKKTSTLILCFFIFSFISSCATQYNHQKNTIVHLKQAVNKLWSARTRQDWTTVYFLTDADYQKNTAKDKFIANGELKQVLEYAIMEIKPVDDQNYETLTKFKIKKMGYVLNPSVNEFWLFEPGKGWVLNKTKMFSKKPF